MTKNKTIWFIFLFIAGLVFLGCLYIAILWCYNFEYSKHYIYPAKVESTQVNISPNDTHIKATSTIIFVGDIMLSRNVERTMEMLGYDYVYKGLGDLFVADSVIANFEGSIPATHVPTPDFTFKFSVNQKFLPSLLASGVTHLSLANNHSLDYGSEGYQNTRQVLAGYGFEVFGHPSLIATSSIKYIESGDKTVGILALTNLFVKPTEVELSNWVSQMKAQSDVQIAYIHWGEEYELVHNASQETLAHMLVDDGIDLVVGHHPHVVQDVEKYKNAIIFYSLGNFIFDQYWDDEVRSGLLLKLTNLDSSWEVDLVPVESITTRLQPHKMATTSRDRFLTSLANRGDSSIAPEVMTGKIPLDF